MLKRGFLIGWAILTGSFSAGAQDFIVVSDLPYTRGQQETLVGSIAPAIAASGAELVIHAGDTKGGKEACSNAILMARRDSIYGLLPGRVVFTPGDNDWTDCDRDGTGEPVSEYDRLETLRALYFQPAPDAPQEWGLVRQPNYPENARWKIGATVFLTLHIVGTNNGRMQVFLDDIEYALAQVQARDQANRVWLKQAVLFAQEQNATALVVAAQADVTDSWGEGPCQSWLQVDCDAFDAVRSQLRQAAKTFGGPMLFLHGDTSPYCLDRTFGGEEAPFLWRLNAAGDYAVIDAVRVSIQASREVPFEITTLVGGLRPARSC